MPKTLNALRNKALQLDRLAEKIGVPFEDWAHNCHSISLRLLTTGEFGPGRVARGLAKNVLGQHSWIVCGQDVYARDALVVDPVLWSYDRAVTGIWTGRNRKRHFPHGSGMIWDYPRPPEPREKAIGLTPGEPFSRGAQHFLDALGPLDMRGWMALTAGPMEGWPAAEIIAAIDDTPALRAVTPIDILGMLTDRNPRELYF